MRYPIATTLALIFAASLAPWAGAQPPDYEVRTYLVDPGAQTDASHQFALSKLKGRYVCPECGYSSDVPGNCPDLLNVPGHGGAVPLEERSLAERILSLAVLPKIGAADPPCDIKYRDTDPPTGPETWDTPNQFRAVVGRPFHPEYVANAGTVGSLIHAEFAWRNRPAGWEQARVHFVVHPPGVKESYGYYDGWEVENYGDAEPYPPDWQRNTWYVVGQRVFHNGFLYECIQNHNSANGMNSEPGVGTHWTLFWVQLNVVEEYALLNPKRVADGDTYYVRYAVAATTGLWRLQVFSKLYGLEFDTGPCIDAGATAQPPGPFWVVTASGAAIIRLNRRTDPNPLNTSSAIWEYTFTTHASTRTYPDPSGEDPPTYFGQWPAPPAATTENLGDNTYFNWNRSGIFFQFQNAGDRLVADTDPVIGATGNPARWYDILPGEVGVGRVEVQYRSSLPYTAPTNPTSLPPYYENLAANERVYYVVGDLNNPDIPYLEWLYDGRGPTNQQIAYSRAGRPGAPQVPPSVIEPFATYEADGPASQYLCSEYQVPRTDVLTDGSGATVNDRHGIPVEPGPTGQDAYPRVLLGRLVDTDGNGTPDERDDLVLPGSGTDRRDFKIWNHLVNLPPGRAYTRCPLSGRIFDRRIDVGLYPEDMGNGVSPYFGDHYANTPEYTAPGVRVALQRIDPTGRISQEIVRPLAVPEMGTSPGALLWSNLLPSLRPHLPDESVSFGPQNSFLPPGSPATQWPPDQANPNYQGVPFWVSIDVPKYQPASEPGETPGSNVASNWGYRGMAVAYEPDPRCNALSPDSAHKWDAYYFCPDCGQPQPDPTPAPATRGPYLFECQNPACPGHQWCPVCGAIYPPQAASGIGTCPGDNTTLLRAGQGAAPPERVPTFGYRHVAAERFDPYDIQVSVAKKTELIAAKDNPDLGRATSGVSATAPDDTVVNFGGLPSGRLADPANVSKWGGMAVRNEGNTVPLLMGISRLGAASVEDAWYRLFRPEADQPLHSYGWAGARNPVALDLKHVYHDRGYFAGGTFNLIPLSPNPTDPWRPVNQVPDAPAGSPAAAVLQVGGGPTGDVIGTGQVLGRYSGPQLYFLDQPLNGQPPNGVFDFFLDGNGDGLFGDPSDIAYDSTTAVFDPAVYVAREPYVIRYGSLRISEGRLPYNDYFAKDTAPTPYFTYDANGEPVGLQVIWETDRVSTIGAATGDETPPADDAGGTPNSDSPVNLVYASAALDPNSAGENRNYVWTYRHPRALKVIPNPGPPPVIPDQPLEQNGPVDVYPNALGPNGNLFALWHRTNRIGGGLRTELRMDSRPATAPDWNGSGANEILWTGQDRAEGVRGFYDVDHARGTDPAHWAFWHSGPRGHEKILFKVTFNSGLTRSGVLPVDNSITPEDPAPTVATKNDIDGIGPAIPTDVVLQRFPHGPFTAVKDVSPFIYVPPLIYTSGDATQPQIRVFFAGYARHLRNFDIYEVRFARGDLLNGMDPAMAATSNNHGKLEFPPVPDRDDQGAPEDLPIINPTDCWVNGNFGVGPGEQFESDTMRQDFHSLHLDWSTTSNFLNARGTGDASLVLGLRVRNLTWNGNVRGVHYYQINWGPADARRGEKYDSQQGVYTLIPRFDPTDPDFRPIPPPIAGPVPGQVGATELVEPNTRSLPLGQQRPLRMEIDPTIGRVRFSAPLFNPLNPADESCVFNTTLFPELLDVFVCGKYTPFIKRLTTSPADDDCPTAIMQAGPWYGNNMAQPRPWPLNATNQNLVLFWRRSFGPGQAPYHGRTCYMMKAWSWTLRVDYPPIDPSQPLTVSLAGSPLQGPGMPTELTSLPGWPNLPNRNEFDVDYHNGLIAVWPGVYRWATSANGNQHAHSAIGPGATITVTYTDLNGVQHVNEPHTVGGWSNEVVLPIDTVLAEGPLRVAEETYTVPWSPAAAPNEPRLTAWRYWIFWTSPRPHYDLRDPGDNGSEVRQTSDIYYCTVQPEFPPLTTERRASSLSYDSPLP